MTPTPFLFALVQPNTTATNGNGCDSEEEWDNDNESMYSNQSEQTGGSLEGKEEEDTSERYEEKLMQAMETATEKSAQTRTTALQVRTTWETWQTAKKITTLDKSTNHDNYNNH